MKKKLIIPILLIVVGSVGYFAFYKLLQKPESIVQTTLPEGYQTYTNADLGVTVSVPKDWVITAIDETGNGSTTKVTISSPDLETKHTTVGGGEIIRKGGEFGFSSEPVTDEEQERITLPQAKTPSGDNFVSREAITVDGQTVFLDTYLGDFEDLSAKDQRKLSSAAFFYNGKLYSFSFTYGPSLINHDEILKNFIEGFKISR